MKRLLDTYRRLTPDALLLFWLGVWWACNLLQAGLTELADDEAYYHMFAEGLAWGYFDHPPAVALLVRLGSTLLGGELGVRLCFTLLQPLYLWILWRLVRPADATRGDASLFAVVSAATLMLQLYGFIAVPDGPLMFTSALFLAALNALDRGQRPAWLWLGLTMAAMAYSKYHGALVVLFALAANPRLLRRPALYAGGGLALLLLVPHLVWQADHDWASFAYHLSGRNASFRWNYVAEFLLNMLAVFNPLFVPLYVRAWREVRPATAVGRALRWMPAAFVGFFLLSSLRGYVQPQWTIVASFGWVWLLFAYARRHPRTRRYVVRAGLVTVALVGLVRLEMIFNPLGLRFEVFDNRPAFGALARHLRSALRPGGQVRLLHGRRGLLPAQRLLPHPPLAVPRRRHALRRARGAGGVHLRTRRHDAARALARPGRRQPLHLLRRSRFPARAPRRRRLRGASAAGGSGRQPASRAHGR